MSQFSSRRAKSFHSSSTDCYLSTKWVVTSTFETQNNSTIIFTKYSLVIRLHLSNKQNKILLKSLKKELIIVNKDNLLHKSNQQCVLNGFCSYKFTIILELISN